ncbi:MAG: hypothetical protein Kow00121_00690 [Elainellaceae cyanobacterium]
MMLPLKLELFLPLIPTAMVTVALPVKAQEAPIVYRYQCSAGQTFEAEYSPEVATIQLEDETLTLTQIPAASGVRYSDGTTTLYTKGNEAFIQVDDEITYNDCLGQAIASEAQPASSSPPDSAPVPALW